MQNLINQYEHKTVAVTGASGYLASALIDDLKNIARRILRVSRKDLFPISGTEVLKTDILLKQSWLDIVNQADIVFHLAGNTSVYTAAKYPGYSLSSTLIPITHIITASQETRRRIRVVFASTATVYGLTTNLPVSEDSVTEPNTNYDLHKLFAEDQHKLATKQGILEGVSLRLANVYGPSLSVSSAADRGVLNKIILMALNGANLQLYGDGRYIRDYIYIDDVVRAFIVAGVAKRVVGRSFNVASGKGITLREAFYLVANQVAKVTKRKVYIENVPFPDSAASIEFRNFVADISQFTKTTGWKAQIDLTTGINKTIESYI